MDRLEQPEIPTRKDFKEVYFDFLKDFREYLTEYMRDTVYELCIAELPVTISGPTKIFNGSEKSKARLKNQGELACYISTTGMGGYRMDPGEVVEFFINKPVVATTLSGTTTISFIKT